MLDVFESNLIRDGLLKKGDRLVLGVSGGPDSMAMLDMFLKIRERWHLGLFVVHVNHGFRGDLACRDAESVEAYCNDKGIEFYRFDYDVMDLSKKWGMSFEEAGRKVRYQAFEDVRKQVEGHRIAVAQNKNDQAETILMRLMRGTGLDGLKGIPIKRGPHIIRPVLFMNRAEIEAYCEDQCLPVCHDHTNDETIYTRNKIRHELIPYIEKNFNGQLVDGLFRLGKMLEDDVDFIETSLDGLLLEKGINLEKTDQIDSKWFNTHHKALRSRLIRRVVDLKGNGLKNVSHAQVEEVIDLIEGLKHGKRKIISGIEFSLKYDTLYFRKINVENDKESRKSVNKMEFEITELSAMEYQAYTLMSNEVSVDLDKIDGKLSARYRKDGDKFQPMGMKGRKKLKKFFIDLKIPAEIRDLIPLVCDESGIIWVVGHRLSERVKVDDTSRRIGILKWPDSC